MCSDHFEDSDYIRSDIYRLGNKLFNPLTSPYRQVNKLFNPLTSPYRQVNKLFNPFTTAAIHGLYTRLRHGVYDMINNVTLCRVRFMGYTPTTAVRVPRLLKHAVPKLNITGNSSWSLETQSGLSFLESTKKGKKKDNLPYLSLIRVSKSKLHLRYIQK